MKKLLITGTIIGISACQGLAALTVEDFCDPKITEPAKVKEMTPLNDGTSYAAISNDGKSIDVYSYKTGEKLSTLFSIDGVKGDLKIDDFEGYTLSSNEKKILLWRNSKKIYRYSFEAEYYVYDILRSTLSRVSEGGLQRGAVMSHDGRMVAYMRANNIFISDIDYKSDIAITSDGKVNEIINGIPDWAYEEEFGMLNSMEWSADDNTLAFIRFDESKVPVYSFDDYRSYCDEDPLGDPYPTAYRYKYPLPGYPNSTVQVLAYNVDNRTTKKMDIEIGDAYVPSLHFDGKGENLMVTVLNRDQNDLKLYRVNPGSTVAHLIYTEKSDAWLSPQAFLMTGYYDNSFVIGSEKTGYRHLYEYDYNGNLLRTISSGDWNVTEYYGRKSASGPYYAQTTILGAINRNVVAIDAKGNAKILNNIEGTESANFSKDFGYFLRTYSSASVPPQYTLCNASGKKLVDVELNAEYASKYAAAPRKEFLKVKNAVGEEMDAYVIYPKNFNPSQKYPLLMYQYNGPDSQLVLNSWKMDGTYYFANRGYVVATVDGRGTGNRNRAWSTSVYKNLGQYETADQLAGAAYFAAQPYIDSAKTACFGWSYGGYMTLMELANKDCKFKAGVAMAAVTDWRFYDSIYTERFMLTPQQNKTGYDAASALEKSQNVDARLLIMSGTSDDNVHFYNTLKYTSKMNFEGKIFDMMALTGFEHSLRMGNARTMLYRKIVDFLDTNVK